eukprot:TRINITY_DN20933_c0_g1_i1.p1 TRINITY_DN20933_c0_g1~~TRINITY_DN20933_c0_g1_i1.p1  ORF type:complete len:525 (+),score=100.04 TRINITY_DN20933_c0_g1_i1:34-1608(+)
MWNEGDDDVVSPLKVLPTELTDAGLPLWFPTKDSNTDFDGTLSIQMSPHSPFCSLKEQLLSPISEEQLGIGIDELTEAILAKPVNGFQPDPRISAPTEKVLKECKLRQRSRIDSSLTKIDPACVDLFLRCYLGKVVASNYLTHLRNFIFSVPPQTAEAHQQAALDIYVKDLLHIISIWKKNVQYIPQSDTPRDRLRLHIYNIITGHGSILKERKKDLYPLQVSPTHHYSNIKTTESDDSKESRYYYDMQLVNPGSRNYRFWLHDIKSLYASDMSGSGDSKNYDFQILHSSSGESSKKSSQPLAASLIVPNDEEDADRGCIREIVILETEFGFRHFISVEVVNPVHSLSRSLTQTGLIKDWGYFVPPSVVMLKQRFYSCGSHKLKDVFSPCKRSGLPSDWEDLLREESEPTLTAPMLLAYLGAIPGSVFGKVSCTPQISKDPLSFVHSLPVANQQLSFWTLHFLSSILSRSESNQTNSRVLALSMAPSLFFFPSVSLAQLVALNQQAVQLLNLLITNYKRDIYDK